MSLFLHLMPNGPLSFQLSCCFVSTDRPCRLSSLEAAHLLPRHFCRNFLPKKKIGLSSRYFANSHWHALITVLTATPAFQSSVSREVLWSFLMGLAWVPMQVVLAPNFKAMVSRSLYEDPAYPDCRFVDLAELSEVRHIF